MDLPGGTYTGEAEGMVWDEERRKYFGIIPDILANPSNLKYTASYVKQQKAAAERRKLEEKARIARQVGRIKRSRLHTAVALPAVDFRRSIDPVKSTALLDGRLQAHLASFASCEAKSHGPGLTIHSMAVDKPTRSIVAGGESLDGACTMYQTSLAAWTLQAVPLIEGEIGTGPHHASAITDISYTPSRAACFILSGPWRIDYFCITLHSDIWPAPGSHHNQLGTEPIIAYDDLDHMQEETVIYAIAANPFVEDGIFAIGTYRGFSIHTHPADSHWTSDEDHKRAPSDVVALDWLSENVLALGQKNGKIRLFDRRVNGSKDRIRCHGPLNVVRCVDANRIIARGVLQEPGLWDLRALDHFRTVPRPGAKPDKEDNVKTIQIDVPLVSYRGTTGPDRDGARTTGLDLLAERDLLAIGDSEGGVHIFRISTGDLLHRLLAPTNELTVGLRVSCLLWVDDKGSVVIGEGGTHGLALLGAKGDRAIKWDCRGSWEREERVVSKKRRRG